MKLIKMLGLAAVAATAAMAFIGTSGAAASTLYIALCKEDVLVCPAGKLISHIHEVAEDPKLLTSFGTILCATSLALGDVLSAGLLAHLWLLISLRFTYASCTLNGGACTVTELGGPANVEVMKTGAETSEVLGEGEQLVNCSGFHCVYNGEELKGTGSGPLVVAPNGQVNANGQKVKKVSGFFCPSESTLDAIFLPLEKVYLSS